MVSSKRRATTSVLIRAESGLKLKSFGRDALLTRDFCQNDKAGNTDPYSCNHTTVPEPSNSVTPFVAFMSENLADPASAATKYSRAIRLNFADVNEDSPSPSSSITLLSASVGRVETFFTTW